MAKINAQGCGPGDITPVSDIIPKNLERSICERRR
jgi:hypothetical protein